MAVTYKFSRSQHENQSQILQETDGSTHTLCSYPVLHVTSAYRILGQKSEQKMKPCFLS